MQLGKYQEQTHSELSCWYFAVGGYFTKTEGQSASTSSVFFSDTTNSKTVSAKFNPITYYGGYVWTTDNDPNAVKYVAPKRSNLRRPGGRFLNKTIAIGQMPCVAHHYELEVRKILPKYIHMVFSKEAELLTAWLLGETSWNNALNEVMFFRTTQATKHLKDRITKCVIHIIRGKSINYETIHFSLVLLRYDRFCQYIKRTRPSEACPEGAH